MIDKKMNIIIIDLTEIIEKKIVKLQIHQKSIQIYINGIYIKVIQEQKKKKKIKIIISDLVLKLKIIIFII